MENTNKNSNVIWGVVILVVVVVFGVWMFTKSGTDSALPEEVVTPVAETPSAVVTPSKNGDASVTLSYEKALATYKDKRIQLGLGTSCKATPDTVTYKNGTSIMIDNRSPNDRTFKLGATYSVKGFGYKIVKLSSDTVPTKWLLDCDKQQNVATVLIQK